MCTFHTQLLLTVHSQVQILFEFGPADPVPVFRTGIILIGVLIRLGLEAKLTQQNAGAFRGVSFVLQITKQILYAHGVK